MTATVILQLAQEAKVSLDDPISKYRADVPNGDTITIAELLDMRSGLAGYTENPVFGRAVDEDPERIWSPEELLALAFSAPALSAPGTTWQYSNTNYVLLGLVMEDVTGQTVPELFQERIFDPLGLDSTVMPALDDASIPAAYAHGYQFGTAQQIFRPDPALPADEQQEAADGELLPTDWSGASPSVAWTAGSAISTADDLVVWAKALVDGGLLDAEMQAQRLASIQPLDPAQPDGPAYGSGMVRGGSYYGHAGQIAGYESQVIRDPETDTTIVVLAALPVSPDGGGPASELTRVVREAPARNRQQQHHHSSRAGNERALTEQIAAEHLRSPFACLGALHRMLVRPSFTAARTSRMASETSTGFSSMMSCPLAVLVMCSAPGQLGHLALGNVLCFTCDRADVGRHVGIRRRRVGLVGGEDDQRHRRDAPVGHDLVEGLVEVNPFVVGIVLDHRRWGGVPVDPRRPQVRHCLPELRREAVDEHHARHLIGVLVGDVASDEPAVGMGGKDERAGLAGRVEQRMQVGSRHRRRDRLGHGVTAADATLGERTGGARPVVGAHPRRLGDRRVHRGLLAERAVPQVGGDPSPGDQNHRGRTLTGALDVHLAAADVEGAGDVPLPGRRRGRRIDRCGRALSVGGRAGCTCAGRQRNACDEGDDMRPPSRASARRVETA